MKDSHSLKIRLLPGLAAKLNVEPEEDVTIENGSPAHYNITIYDVAGNATGDGRQVVNAWVNVLSFQCLSVSISFCFSLFLFESQN